MWRTNNDKKTHRLLASGHGLSDIRHAVPFMGKLPGLLRKDVFHRRVLHHHQQKPWNMTSPRPPSGTATRQRASGNSRGTTPLCSRLHQPLTPRPKTKNTGARSLPPTPSPITATAVTTADDAKACHVADPCAGS